VLTGGCYHIARGPARTSRPHNSLNQGDVRADVW